MRCARLAFAFALFPSLSWADDVLTADEAVRAALACSPDLASAQADLDTARAQLRQDRLLLGNPEVGASASLTTPKQSLDISQPLSLTGEGWRARTADRAFVEAAALALTRGRLTLARETRGAWALAVVANDRAELATDALTLATQLRDGVEKRKARGDASDLDLRLVRLSEASAAGAWLEARRALDESRENLVRLVGPTVARLPKDPLAAAPSPTTAVSARSDLAAADARVRAAEAALARARAASFPAIRLGAFVERDGADLAAGPSLGLEIPLWNRNQADIAERTGESRIAQAEADELHAVATVEATQAAALASDAETVAALGSTALLDDAHAALTEVDAAYRAGELDLADAIQLRNEVIDGETAVLDVAAQVVEARLDLLLATEDPALLPEGVR